MADGFNPKRLAEQLRGSWVQGDSAGASGHVVARKARPVVDGHD
jgi:hypothetical protein